MGNPFKRVSVIGLGYIGLPAAAGALLRRCRTPLDQSVGQQSLRCDLH